MLFAMLLACTVLVSRMSLHAIADGVCSTSMAPLQVNKIQTNNGNRGDTFTWIFSPGKLTSTFPSSKLACTPSEIYGAKWSVEAYNLRPYECMKSQVSTTPTSDGCIYKASGSTGNEFVMTVSCGTSEDLAFTGDSVDVTVTEGFLVYNVKLTSSMVCPGGGGSSSSDKPACTGGCAFLIIVFVGAALYVLIVVLWNILKEGKRGLEAAPHPEIWQMVPGLIKDGVMYSKFLVMTPCRNSRSTGGSYSEV